MKRFHDFDYDNTCNDYMVSMRETPEMMFMRKTSQVIL